MKKNIFALSCAVLAMTLSPALAGSHPDDHAPIGVMGDHHHKEGEFMMSYRYMRMGMDGVHSGSNGSSVANALTEYNMTPTEMTGEMHMVGAMYGLTNDITLTVMGSYIERTMDIYSPMMGGMNMRRSTRGFGDTKVGAITKIFEENNDTKFRRNNDTLYLNTSLSLPTGQFDVMDDNNSVGYPMRLGTGTFDPTIGLTYVGKRRGYSFGAQALGTFRLYKNDDRFQAGNLYQASLWTQANLNDAISASVSLRGFRQDRTDGADPALNSAMAFPFNPTAQEREGVDIGFGFNIAMPHGTALEGQRLGIEVTTPVYERINGYGLERDYRLTAGWQYAF